MNTLEGTFREEIDCYRCGFCGGNSSCSITLKKTTHQTLVPDSNYPYKMKFSLASADKSTVSGPCTNQPVSCSICKVVYWNYSIKRHYEEKHRDSVCTITITNAEIEYNEKEMSESLTVLYFTYILFVESSSISLSLSLAHYLIIYSFILSSKVKVWVIQIYLPPGVSKFYPRPLHFVN